MSEQSVRNIPFELYMNLVFLQVYVNNSKRLSFNVDTGLETSILDSGQAEAMGLKLVDKSNVNVPGGTIELAFANDVSLKLSGIELSNQRMQTLPLTIFAPVLGRPIHGILGHDLFKRFVVEIDYARQVIHLYEPNDYQYSGSGEIIPVTIENDEPFMQAKILQPERAPIEAKLKIDTGSTDVLGLNGSFVQNVQLVNSTQRVLPQPGVALGGITENYVTRLGGLQIGALFIKNPVAGYSKDLTRGGDAGTIGGGIFRRFKVIFDYSRGQMILEKNKYFDEPYTYDASGLFLVAEGASFESLKILRITENTPATIAGLREGDIILQIDGQPTGTFSLEQVRQMFEQEGRSYSLTIERNGKTSETTLELRKLI
jgi:PDZ domain-containing protein/aspartyl protease